MKLMDIDSDTLGIPDTEQETSVTMTRRVWTYSTGSLYVRGVRPYRILRGGRLFFRRRRERQQQRTTQADRCSSSQVKGLWEG